MIEPIKVPASVDKHADNDYVSFKYREAPNKKLVGNSRKQCYSDITLSGKEPSTLYEVICKSKEATSRLCKTPYFDFIALCKTYGLLTERVEASHEKGINYLRLLTKEMTYEEMYFTLWLYRAIDTNPGVIWAILKRYRLGTHFLVALHYEMTTRLWYGEAKNMLLFPLITDVIVSPNKYAPIYGSKFNFTGNMSVASASYNLRIGNFVEQWLSGKFNEIYEKFLPFKKEQFPEVKGIYERIISKMK